MGNYNPTLTALARRAIADSGLDMAVIAHRAGFARSNLRGIAQGRTGVGEEPARRILAACGQRLVITAEPIDAEVVA